MNKQTEALKMAIEALESCSMLCATHDYSDYFYESIGDALQACKEALEQPPPKVEPFDVWAGTKPQESLRFANAVIDAYKDGYEACKAEQPAQEPVAWMDKYDEWSDEITQSHPLKTKSYLEYDIASKMVSNRHSKSALVNLVCWLLQKQNPAPSWQGLSVDEIQEELKKMWDKGLIPSYSIVAFARAIEQALKEKNT